MAAVDGEDAREPGLLGTAALLVLDPTRAGESLARRPGGTRLYGVLLLLVAIVVSASALTYPQQLAMVREKGAERLRKVPAETRARVMEMYEGPAMRAVLIASPAAATVIGVLFVAFLLYLGQLAMEGQATFLMTLSVTAFACLLSIGLQTVVMAAIVLARDSADVSAGLGMLLADRPMSDPMRSLLDALNPFVIAATACGGIALAPPARIARASTLGVSIAVWLLLTGGKTLFRIFFA